MLHSLLFIVGVSAALSILNAAWRAFWTSATGVRSIGSLQRLNRRIFGAPPPQPVELGPDGRWRPYVAPKTRRAERWAGIVILIIGALFIIGGFVSKFTAY